MHFKRIIVLIGVGVVLLFCGSTDCVFAQNNQDNMNGMMGGMCPMCGQQWGDQNQYNQVIPEKLPKPKNAEWIKRLHEVLSLEKLSQIQYESDSSKYNTNMPYIMIILQEKNHIQWISALFKAYDITAEDKSSPVEKSDTVEQAYRIARQQENNLIPRYEWLIKNGEDSNSKQVLNNILFQTRMHYTMFDHALKMEGMGMGMR